MTASQAREMSSASRDLLAVNSRHPLSGLYAVTIFSSAFLLFEIQPMMAKIILPKLGGAAAVWIVCLLFFQTVLLLGYSYAHWLTTRFRPTAQRRIHIALLAVSLAALPAFHHSAWITRFETAPELRLLMMLASSIGLPYFLLSATSPLLQSWCAHSNCSSAPYRLYALSNAGSLLALLSYPVGIEPFLSSSHQETAWSAAYVMFAGLCGLTALYSRAQSFSAESKSTPRPSWEMQALWASLAACGSALLLAITNHISQNIAPVPLLWIVPLTLYLLTFILCFEGRGWYRRKFFLRLLAVALGSMTYALSADFSNLPLRILVPLFCAGLFVCCVVCHGELARLKPSPEYLTNFYLLVSLGGALGALFVALVAPHLFSGFYELPIILGFCTILVVLILYRDSESPLHDSIWSLPSLGVMALALTILVGLFLDLRGQAAETRTMVRNFYGVLRVRDQQIEIDDENNDQPSRVVPYRRLINGTITHGWQFLSPALRGEPTTYYSRVSGVGVALTAAGKSGNLRVGAIGLGVGTIAAYGRPGDRFTFYEINPLVVRVANQEFTFLRDSAAQVSTVLGDARLSLQSEDPQAYDLLIVDAFSGDAIPIHLLTREAFELYFRHLKPGGLLLVHVSNKHLDLPPVVLAGALASGHEAILIDNGPDKEHGVSSATWVAVGKGILFDKLRGAGKPLADVHPLPWTDDHSSLLPILK